MLTAADADWLVGLKQKRKLALKVQLTYNHQNHLATGCLAWDKNRYLESGLSGLGEEVAKILLRGGIVVDVSHLNRQSTMDVCEIGKQLGKPVIASHSNALAVFEQGNCPDKMRVGREWAARRCLDDKEITAILETGGYVGLTPQPYFLSIGNCDDVLGLWVSHINRVRKVAEGARINLRGSVALASDVDRQDGSHAYKLPGGAGIGPRGSVALVPKGEKQKEDILRMPPGRDEKSYKNLFFDLARALERRSWLEEDIDALFHGNVERVFPQKK